VGIPEPKRRLASYPHEMSGGQQQRVMIAMALACEPKLLIADEPTTALDVTIQRQIMELLARLKTERRMSVLFISHDLGLVGEIADQVVVMRHGRCANRAPWRSIFERPQDAYTKALLACRPSLEGNPARLMVIDDHIAGAQRRRHGRRAGPRTRTPRWCWKCARWPRASGSSRACSASASSRPCRTSTSSCASGHTLGVVGESGSGKTTMGLTLLRLHEPTGGEVIFDGQNLLTLSDRERQAMRRRIQIVFQNPYASLNPRFTIGQTLVEPMAIHGIGASTAEREQRARTCWKRWAWTAAPSASTRTNFPAASASAWPSPAA
jgi:peptide/nickel transport system ATP-binding protein